MKTDRLVSRQYGALLVGAFVTMMAPATHAETRLTGQVDAVRMEVRDASFEEIFDALGASYGLRFRSATPLGGRISGTFEGPLLQVVARMLDRYDYIVKKTDGVVDIVVLGAHGRAASPTNIPSVGARPPAGTQQQPVRSPSVAPGGPPAPDWETRPYVPSSDRRPR